MLCLQLGQGQVEASGARTFVLYWLGIEDENECVYGAGRDSRGGLVGTVLCLFVVQFLSHLGCVKSVCLGDGHSKGNWEMLPLKVATPS